MRLADDVLGRIERAEGLDRLTRPVIDAVAKAVRPRWVRNWLSGTPLGHPAHPLLTDLPIGTWAAATLLDLAGGTAAEPGADLLVKAGVLAALPTAASGLNDWHDTFGPVTRIGLVHAGANTGALLLYGLSARCRHHGHRSRGKLLGLAGFATLLTGSYLGGHLSFTKGTNVNAVADEHGPADWTEVMAEDDLPDGAHRKVTAAGTDVLLWRDGSTVWAISATCSHMGGPLDEGEFADGCVTCSWHGSVFRLRDGGIERGPACVTQPIYQTRVTGGRIQVRAAS